MLDKTIRSLVEENYLHARALDQVGIDFSAHKDSTLLQTIRQYGMDRSVIMRRFYLSESNFRPGFREIKGYPIPLLISYLRHSHTHYIKERLPYIHKLIDKVKGIDDESFEDLKAVFPLFVEDFIHHIYEEEDELFSYMLLLEKASRLSLPEDFARIADYAHVSLQEILDEHLQEDEMKNMRELTEELPACPLELNVVISELRAFDRELQYHAEIENSMLFPKAIELESALWQEVSNLKTTK